jgi:hypothetical protein
MDFPAVAILGPRQCGKTTLARAVTAEINNCIYLDLERPSDRNKLHEPELFFRENQSRLVCLDEIQRIPEIFTVLRSVIDSSDRNGQFLILGSASPDLIRQSSESLAGRIAYIELPPFVPTEVIKPEGETHQLLNDYWLKGGFPRSYLSRDEKKSMNWRKNFILTFLERDIPQLGLRISAESLRRFWMMSAHYHGQISNLSKLGESLGVSHTTVRSYIDLLVNTFMLRKIAPFETNLKKRLVKSPKFYLRDTGILHALLDLETYDDLMGHPVFGASWEGLVLENVSMKFQGWNNGFYRTAAGAELDLVLEKRGYRIAIECKASAAPQVTQGFWNCIQDLKIKKAWVIAPVDSAYPLGKNVTVSPLLDFLKNSNTFI